MMLGITFKPFRYLSKEILDGFDNYKYCSVDTSPVSNYISHPFWNRVVEFVPKTIAPNVLTLSGFSLLVVNFAVTTYYDPAFYASSRDHPQFPILPAWVFLMCGINNFLSHTLDGIDGKQARRTNSSSPLGELFDHGLDSWATFFLSVVMYSLFGRGVHGASIYLMYQIVLGVMACFILSHWEKYNTGVLFLPWGYDLSQITMSFVYLVTYFTGTEIWTTPLPAIDTPLSTFIIAFVNCTFVFLTLPQTFWNVYVSYRDKTGKMLSVYESLRPLISTVIVFSILITWSLWSPSKIMEKEPRLYYWVTGAIFSNIACRLIVSQMSETRADSFHWIIVPLVCIVTYILSFPCPAATELSLLWFIAILSTITHIHYGVCVVVEMCEHFNIHAFCLKNTKHH